MFEQDFPNHVFSNSAIFLGWWTKLRHLRCYAGVYVYTMQLVQIHVRGGTKKAKADSGILNVPNLI